MQTPSNPSNVVDFATYRFARDLRLTEARTEAQDEAARLAANAPGPQAPARDTPLSESAVAHRARMLQHLALGARGTAQSEGRQ